MALRTAPTSSLLASAVTVCLRPARSAPICSTSDLAESLPSRASSAESVSASTATSVLLDSALSERSRSVISPVSAATSPETRATSGFSAVWSSRRDSASTSLARLGMSAATACRSLRPANRVSELVECLEAVGQRLEIGECAAQRILVGDEGEAGRKRDRGDGALDLRRELLCVGVRGGEAGQLHGFAAGGDGDVEGIAAEGRLGFDHARNALAQLLRLHPLPGIPADAAGDGEADEGRQRDGQHRLAPLAVEGLAQPFGRFRQDGLDFALGAGFGGVDEDIGVGVEDVHQRVVDGSLDFAAGNAGGANGEQVRRTRPKEQPRAADVERAQLVLAAGEGLAGEVIDGRQQATHELSAASAVHALDGLARRKPAIDEHARGPLDEEEFANPRAAAFHHREFAIGTAGKEALQPQPQELQAQAALELLVRAFHGVAHGGRDIGRDQPAHDRIERLNHLVARVDDLAFDRGDDEGRDGAGKFPVILDVCGFEAVGQNLGDGFRQPVVGADAVVMLLDDIANGGERMPFLGKQQLLEADHFRLLTPACGHGC